MIAAALLWLERRLRGYTAADIASLREKVHAAYRTLRQPPLTRWERNAYRARKHLPRGHMIRTRR